MDVTTAKKMTLRVEHQPNHMLGVVSHPNKNTLSFALIILLSFDWRRWTEVIHEQAHEREPVECANAQTASHSA